MPNINLHHKDCLKAMKKMEDNQFDLAIVDPPYGIGEGSDKIKSRHHSQHKYKTSDWDQSAPSIEYFEQLKRVSKNQIIWGANHFLGWTSSCWIVWDKDTGQCDFADCELAWTSFKTAVRKFTFTWNGFRQGYGSKNKEIRIHPTQKPIALYRWLLKNYAKPGDKILDTHAGSFSIGIACHDMGYDLEAYEIDEDYYKAAKERFENHIKQGVLFEPQETKKIEQLNLDI